MNRREAIRQLAFLTGGALSMSTIAGVMGGCTTKKSGSFSPKTLSDSQNELVTVISEHIIPATDTPGAKAAGVNQFIDHMLTDWNTDAERKHFLAGLDGVDKTSNSSFNENFLDLDDDQQVEVLKKLEQEASNNPDPVTKGELPPFFSMMKEFTIVGYYTSEIGASKELKSNLIPGRYDGCVPYSEIGRAWSRPGT